MTTQERILYIFLDLWEHDKISTAELTEKYNISTRTAQRDIQKLKKIINEISVNKANLVKTNDSYHLIKNFAITKKELLVLIKILLSSKALNDNELRSIISSLLKLVPKEDQTLLIESIKSEVYHITPLKNKRNRISSIWELNQLILNKTSISFTYLDYEWENIPKEQKISTQPAHIFFNNFYFYLVGYDYKTKTFKNYRIDWMSNIHSLSNHSSNSTRSKYSPNRVKLTQYLDDQSKKITLTIEFTGYIEYLYDKFPSAKLIKNLNSSGPFGFPTRLVEIPIDYSEGIKLWLLMESMIVKVVKPKYVAEDIKKLLDIGINNYKNI